MKYAKIETIYEVGRHEYDDTNRETAYRVKLSNGRRCWLVGYGADHMPAKKTDIINIMEVHTPEDWEIDGMIGTIVYAYC